jgi:hypothetical protein
MIFKLPFFHDSKAFWIERDKNLEELFSTLEEKLSKRNESLPALPLGKVKSFIKDISLFEKDCKIILESEKLSNISLNNFRNLAKNLIPLVQASSWARWLDLEAGLAIALNSGNLLSATTLTRILAEECLRGISLEECCKLLLAEPTSSLHSDLKRVSKNFLDWGLPRTRQKSIQDLEKKSRTPKRNSDNKVIDLARVKLNDYVHPNYGSHRIAYDPFFTKAPVILCECLVEIYNRFYEKPWLNFHRFIKKKYPDNQALEENYINRQLAQIHEKGKKNKNLSSSALEIGYENLIIKHDKNIDIYEQIVLEKLQHNEDFKKLALALGVESSVLKSTIKANIYPFYSTETVSNWILAVESFQCLEDAVGDEDLLNRINRAISLFITLTNLKKPLIKNTLQLTMALRLPISSAALCRSLLEYHAISCWVSENLDDGSESVISSRKQEELENIDKLLCSSLIGSRSTDEENSDMRLAWIELFGDDPVDIACSINSLQRPLAFEYDLLSHTVHGSTLRGADFLGKGGQEVTDNALARTLSVYGQLSDITAIVSESPIRGGQRLRNLSQAIDSGMAFDEASSFIKLPNSLVHGRDFFGKGTERNPYKFRAGLDFHEAFYQYCLQEDIKPDRKLFMTEDHIVLDELTLPDGGKIYFMIPKFDQYKSSSKLVPKF